MERNWAWTVAIALCFGAIRPAPVLGQELGGSLWQERQMGAGAGEVASPPELVHEVQPSEYWLPDKDGNLQAVINIPYELFEQIYRRQQEPEETVPAFTVESLQLEGNVQGSHAEITAHVRVRTSRTGWIGIPFRFADAALLSDTANPNPDVDHFLAFDPSAAGYVLWMRSESPGVKQLRLRFLVSVKSVGAESRMELSTPRAAETELKLTVPVAPAAVSLSEGAVLVLQEALNEAASTRFHIAGQGGYLGHDGYLQITWRRDDGRQIAPRPAVEAKGTMLVRLDGQGALSEGTVTVRAFGGPIDRVRLRLPPGAEILADEAAGYEIQLLEPAADTGASRRLVEVRTKEPTAGPIDIRFTATVEPSADKSPLAGWLQLAGVEVVGAVRQSGFVAVATVGDWKVLWGRLRAVQRVDPAELPENLRSTQGLVAAYRYFSRGMLLMARVIPRGTHSTVQANYRVVVRGDEAVLDATLQYTLRGEPVSVLSLDLQQWELKQLGPDSAVAVEAIPLGKSGEIPVSLLRPTTGSFKLVLRARQSLDRNAKRLDLRFPVPSANVLMPAQILIQPAANVELIPDMDKSVGLVRQSSVGVSPTGGSEGAPLVYQAELPAAQFEAGKVVHSREVRARVATLLDLQAARGNVEQRFHYEVAYEPADRLFVDVPGQLAQSGQWQVSYNGQQLRPVVISEQEAADSSVSGDSASVESEKESPGQADRPGNRPTGSEATVRYGLLLPEARTGEFELVVRYRIEVPRLLPRSSVLAHIPLIMPGGATVVANELELVVGHGVLVQPQDAAWKGTVGSSGWLAPAERIKLSCRKADGEVALALYRQDGAMTVVERAWLQTWLGRIGRQDRAVFQLVTQAEQLELWLPVGESLGEVRLRLAEQRGGPWQELRAEMTPAGTVRVWLPQAPESNRAESGHGEEPSTLLQDTPGHSQPVRWLEVQSRYLNTQLRAGRQVVEVPRLLGDVWVRRAYWQVILPANEHLVTIPAGLTPEYHWGWTGTFFGRLESMDQHSLESWVGAPHLTPPPIHATRYLFSSFEAPIAPELVVASRGTIVLLCSGVALVAGLLLLYVRAARHPVALLLMGIAVAAAGAVWPDQALLAAQAAGLGVGLVLLAALVRVVSSWPQRWTRTAESSSILVDRGSTEIHYRPSAGSQQAETAPFAVSGSSVGAPR